MDDGQIVVDSIVPIRLADITSLIRFHYLPPGAWDTPRK
jgi:hypothetical protein